MSADIDDRVGGDSDIMGVDLFPQQFDEIYWVWCTRCNERKYCENNNVTTHSPTYTKMIYRQGYGYTKAWTLRQCSKCEGQIVETEKDDPLSAAKGCMLAGVFGLAFWIVLALIAFS